jgi:predicted ferric reductase
VRRGRTAAAAAAYAQAVLWLLVYLAAVSLPLLLLVCGPRPASRGFVFDLSMALGFAGLSIMGVQFALTARFRRATAPYGIDVIYYLHRYVSLVALAAVVAHPVLIVVEDPAYVVFLDPRYAPPYMIAGLAAIVALFLVALTSFARKRLGLHYDLWRVIHVVFAVAAVLLALVHVHGAGYYSRAGWMGVAWPSMIATWGALAVWVRAVRPWLVWRRPYRVVAVSAERGDAWSVVVEPDGHEGMRFEPGQFAWLSLRSTPFAMRDHPFSIASSSLEAPRLTFTIKELGDFTRTIRRLEPGERAYVDGPYGAFSPDRYDASELVLIAGGIGIAPLMSMLRSLAARGDRRAVTLVYAYRLWERMTFREEIEALATHMPLRVVYVLDEPHPEWTGERGRVTRSLLDRVLPSQRRDAEYFVCGPLGMIHSVENALRSLGVPMRRCHSELFDLV